MPIRLEIAYALIAFMVVSLVIGIFVYRKKKREKRHNRFR